jgi:tetratricopeptide (TPR) repeat protein
LLPDPEKQNVMGQYLADGESYLKKGDLNNALRCFELALEVAPDSHRAMYLSALTHLKLDNEATALVQFGRALEMDPDNPNYLADMAVTKLRLGDKDGAMIDLDRCVELDPGYSYRYSLRAFVRTSMGDVHGAIADYQRAVELDPEDSIAYNNLGMVQEQLGYGNHANENFAKADQLSGRTAAPADHTIDFSRRPMPAAAMNQADEMSLAEPPSPGIADYLTVIGAVITDKAQRQEFFRFIREMFRPGRP